jgi:hypothetical protein
MTDRQRILELENATMRLNGLANAQQVEILRLAVKVEKMAEGPNVGVIEHLLEQAEARRDEYDRLMKQFQNPL